VTESPDMATRHDAPFPYVQRKSALNDDLMLKIELTRGLGWDSPALTVIETMDSRLSSVEKFARQLPTVSTALLQWAEQ
jgi:hypothetical protein